MDTLHFLFGVEDSDNALLGEALRAAARTGQLRAVRHLLGWGADVNGGARPGELPLNLARHGRHADVVRELLAAGALVKHQPKPSPRFGMRAEAEEVIAARLVT